MQVSKEFRFEAAHSLPHLPAAHKCHHLHGHSYVVVVHCSGEIDPAIGWFVDYADISAAAKPVIESLDHKYLNDILPCLTTAECLAMWLYEQIRPVLPSLHAVEIKETASTSVVYSPKPEIV